jgi:hypothetical protein
LTVAGERLAAMWIVMPGRPHDHHLFDIGAIGEDDV